MKKVALLAVFILSLVSEVYSQCGGIAAGNNSGPKTVTGACNITGNVVMTGGNLTISSGAVLTISGYFHNDGNGNVTMNGGTIITGTNFQNNGNGTISVTGGGALTVGTTYFNGGNGTTSFTDGTINITGNFTNDGNGTISAAGVVSVGGNFTNNGNGGLTVDGGLSVDGSLTFTGNGNVTIGTSGVLEANTLDVKKNLSISTGGTLYTPGGAPTVGGTLTNSNPTADTDCTNGCCGAQCNATGTAPNSTAQGTLPVTLLYFKAEQDKNSVLLTWSTATEINTSHFEIHRANESGEFYYLDEVPAYGTTKKRQNYALTDISPAEGINLYKLISVDFDGYREVFSAQSTNSLGGVLNVFPNPFDGYEVNVSKPANLSTPTVKIYALSGQELFCGVMQLGQTKVKLATQLLSGVYILTLHEGAQTFSTRIAVK